MTREKKFGDLSPEERKDYILKLLTRIKHKHEAEQREAAPRATAKPEPAA